MSKITIQLELDVQQAKHYLLWLNTQFEATMAEVWYSDHYRNVPAGLRAPRVVRDIPHLLGISRTRRELQRQLAGHGERAQ
ncbi:hypothetical protein [Pseudomonas monteilii]|uniref:hypothetical protein n=1 Tax=Pseudomonas monteilii TaxID=76759 RepID=UPI00383A12BE